MSKTMEHYLAGLLTHSRALTFFLAPNVNSYKRFVAGTFAPTTAMWSLDNRTAGYRVCGAGSSSIRVECRIGGADLNPYLAFSALLAAGIDGIENALPLPPPFAGDAYRDPALVTIPGTLPEAVRALDESALLRTALGDGVVDHYVHAGRWEQSQFEQQVTDWEVARGFERA